MYDNTEIRIMEQVYRNPGIHERELSKKLGLGMPSIKYGLSKLGGIIKKQKSGNMIKLFLNYSGIKIVPMLYMVEYARIERLPAKIQLAVADFLKELPLKPVIALIFGSYARGDYKGDSDIDILLVYEHLTDTKKIENTANKINMRMNAKLNPVYLNYKDFSKSFHDATKTFFKNVRKDKLIIYGVELWRQLEDEET